MSTDWYDNELEYKHGSAKIICDSINKYGHRLTTVEGILWRPMLAELNTHRTFSRNSASSRAIPLRRNNRRGTLDLIEDHPAGPLFWGSEKPGMQSGDELEEPALTAALIYWNDAREHAIHYAETLSLDCGVHKSIVNRLLEPFMWHRVIITATDWQNFFRQRSLHRSPMAQPEFAALATKIEDLMQESIPTLLDHDQWHLPYILPDEQELGLEARKSISVGRCARVSYLNHDLIKSPREDVQFCKKLMAGDPMHISPFEHVATPYSGAGGNLKGWRQLRHIIEFAKGIESRS